MLNGQLYCINVLVRFSVSAHSLSIYTAFSKKVVVGDVILLWKNVDKGK